MATASSARARRRSSEATKERATDRRASVHARSGESSGPSQEGLLEEVELAGVEEPHLETGEPGPEAEGGPGQLVGALPAAGPPGRLLEGIPGRGQVPGPQAGVAQGQKELDAALPVLRTQIQCLEGPLERCRPLFVGEEVEGPLAGPFPVDDGPVSVAGRTGGEEVMGQLGQVPPGVPSLQQGLPRGPVEGGPAGQWKALVEDFPDQGVAEGPSPRGRLWGGDEVCPPGLVSRSSSLSSGRRVVRGQEIELELLAGHGGGGESLQAGRGQPAQAPLEHDSDAAGDREVPRGQAESPLFGDQASQLENEERVTGAAPVHVGHQPRVGASAGGEGEELADGLLVQSLQDEYPSLLAQLGEEPVPFAARVHLDVPVRRQEQHTAAA